MRECKNSKCGTLFPDHYTNCPSCKGNSWKTVLRKEQYKEYDDIGNEREILTVVVSEYKYDFGQ